MTIQRGLVVIALCSAACSDDAPGSIDAPVIDAAAIDARPIDAVDAPPDARAFDAPGPDAPPGIPPLTFIDPVPTAQFGSPTGGNPFLDACPSGQALVGFAGSLTSPTGYHGRLAGVCGAVTMVANGPIYQVRVGAGATLPTRGILGTTPWTRMCPADMVVIGFAGRSGDLVDQLSFRCAAIIVMHAGADWEFFHGAPLDLAPVGGSGGNAFPQTDCGGSTVATATNLRAGDGIDRFGLVCRTISVQ